MGRLGSWSVLFSNPFRFHYGDSGRSIRIRDLPGFKVPFLEAFSLEKIKKLGLVSHTKSCCVISSNYYEPRAELAVGNCSAPRWDRKGK